MCTHLRNLLTFTISLSLFTLLSLSTMSCASLRALMPGGVTPSDAEWTGVKSGPPVSVASSLDPRAAALDTILGLIGQGNSLGVVMPVLLPGETQPRWILCTGDFTQKCVNIPINTKVKFAGSPIGPGILWKPSRLTVD